jgi:O-antigen/teichoic acid export membrane protein
MNSLRRLIAGPALATVLVGAGTIAYVGSQWALLVLFARMATATDVGQYSLALGIATPVALALNLGLRQAQAVDSGDASLPEYMTLRVVTGMLAGALTITFCLVSSVPLMLAVGVAAAKFVEGIADVLVGDFHRAERFATSAKGQSLRAMAALIAGGLTIFITGNIVLAIFLSAGASAVCILGFDARATRSTVTRRRHNLVLDVSMLKGILRLAIASAPLGLGAMLAAFNTHIPRYFLALQTSHAEIGVYAVVSSFAVGLNVVVNSAGQAISPSLARLFKERQHDAFRRLVLTAATRCALAGIVLAVIGQFAGATLVRLVFGEPYASHEAAISAVFFILPVSSAASILNYALVATNRFFLPPTAAACQTLAVGAAATILVHTHGVAGAVWSWGIGYTCQLSVTLLLLRLALVLGDKPFARRLVAQGGVS